MATSLRGSASFRQRSALALAEALLPGSAAIPGADETTVALAEELVRHFEPRLLAAWRVAQGALSASAIRRTGRPFHVLSAHAQDALVQQWEADPLLRKALGLIGTVYKLVHFDHRGTYETMGGKYNAVQNLESPRWLEQVHRGDEWSGGDRIECEVVVVGTGAGGAVVARELADRGFAVAMVEEGEHYRRDAFDGSAVRAHQRFYRAAFALGNAVIPIFVGRLVGGSTAINTGTSFRTPPWVLERWCEELGSDEFSPDAMQRHFDRVEGELHVTLADRRVIGPIADVMARGCDALGWSHSPVRRNAPTCDGGGFCDFGCRTDARRGTNISYVPPALEKGSLLFTGLRVDRILLERGRAVGLEGVTAKGRRLEVRAPTVVLAGGAIPTPLLLLKQGLANRSGEVGKNLSVHPSGGFIARFDQSINGAAHMPQGYMCDQHQRDGMMILSAQPDFNVSGTIFPFAGRRLMDALDHFDQLAGFGLLIRDESANGRVWRTFQGLPAISYQVSRADVERVHRAMVRTGEICLAAGAKELYPVALGTPPITSAAGFERFRKAKLSAGDVMWTSYHPLGTCRIGSDPATSVVGLDHQAHDVPGLFVVDGSTVPGPLGVNPQITIMAMANRAAEKIAEHLGYRAATQPKLVARREMARAAG